MSSGPVFEEVAREPLIHFRLSLECYSYSIESFAKTRTVACLEQDMRTTYYACMIFPLCGSVDANYWSAVSCYVRELARALEETSTPLPFTTPPIFAVESLSTLVLQLLQPLADVLFDTDLAQTRFDKKVSWKFSPRHTQLNSFLFPAREVQGKCELLRLLFTYVEYNLDQQIFRRSLFSSRGDVYHVHSCCCFVFRHPSMLARLRCSLPAFL